MKKKAITQTDIIRIAAEAGAKAGVEAYNKQIHKAQAERVDRRLRNTKLLLRNYRMFKGHCGSAVYELKHGENSFMGYEAQEGQPEEDLYDILDEINNGDSEYFVESIKKSVARTAIIVKHIDTMLEFYEIYCSKSKNPEEERRYKVIQAHYIDEDASTIKELADEFNITDRTIYRDIDIACERLAALLFGIDGVKKI
jgi:hypothetical protein